MAVSLAPEIAVAPLHPITVLIQQQLTPPASKDVYDSRSLRSGASADFPASVVGTYAPTLHLNCSECTNHGVSM